MRHKRGELSDKLIAHHSRRYVNVTQRKRTTIGRVACTSTQHTLSARSVVRTAFYSLQRLSGWRTTGCTGACIHFFMQALRK